MTVKSFQRKVKDNKDHEAEALRQEFNVLFKKVEEEDFSASTDEMEPLAVLAASHPSVVNNQQLTTLADIWGERFIVDGDVRALLFITKAIEMRTTRYHYNAGVLTRVFDYVVANAKKPIAVWGAVQLFRVLTPNKFGHMERLGIIRRSREYTDRYLIPKHRIEALVNYFRDTSAAGEYAEDAFALLFRLDQKKAYQAAKGLFKNSQNAELNQSVLKHLKHDIDIWYTDVTFNLNNMTPVSLFQVIEHIAAFEKRSHEADFKRLLQVVQQALSNDKIPMSFPQGFFEGHQDPKKKFTKLVENALAALEK